MQGCNSRMIAQRLGCSDDTALRIIRKERDDWEPPDKPADVWRGSRARAAFILTGLGITQEWSAALMGVSPRTLRRYMAECAPCGEPFILVDLLEEVTGGQNERVKPRRYRVLDFGERFALIRYGEQGRLVHFVDGEALRGKVAIPRQDIYGGEPCQN